MRTFGEHHLLDGELVHVHGVVAGCHHLDPVGQLVPVQVHEHPAVGDMVGRDPAPQLTVIVVPERRVASCAVQVRERIHALQDRDVFYLVHLAKKLTHRAGGILWVLYACYAYLVEVFG